MQTNVLAGNGSYASYPQREVNIGHGHVFRRPDGVVYRCGGPRYCVACTGDALEAAIAWCDAVDAAGGSAGTGELGMAQAMLASVGLVLRDQRDSALAAITGAAGLGKRGSGVSSADAGAGFHPMPIRS